MCLSMDDISLSFSYLRYSARLPFAFPADVFCVGYWKVGIGILEMLLVVLVIQMICMKAYSFASQLTDWRVELLLHHVAVELNRDVVLPCAVCVYANSPSTVSSVHFLTCPAC